MARGVNKVILLGNLGNDPDVRYTAGGAAVANISVATAESWRDKESGEQQERTEWHRVVFFGRLAEIVANEMQMLGSKGGSGGSDFAPSSSAPSAAPQEAGNKQQPAPDNDFVDDDIPF